VHGAGLGHQHQPWIAALTLAMGGLFPALHLANHAALLGDYALHGTVLPSLRPIW